MKKNRVIYKHIYGPVSSWRLGTSLGVDPLSHKERVCTFNCVYCQLGRRPASPAVRDVYVPTADIINELVEFPSVHIDYITLSGTGEPTLASNLGEIIREIKLVREEPIAVITNSSLMVHRDVRKDIAGVDLVVAKLDASSPESFLRINHPAEGITFDTVIEGIRQFKKEFRGRLAVQIMFIKKNKEEAEEMAQITKDLDLYEVQLNTPLRPCGVKPLSVQEMMRIKKHFKGIKAVSVYESKIREVMPIRKRDTLRRRGTV